MYLNTPTYHSIVIWTLKSYSDVTVHYTWHIVHIYIYSISQKYIFFLMCHTYSFWATSPYSVIQLEPITLVSVLFLPVPKCLISLDFTQMSFSALVLLNI